MDSNDFSALQQYHPIRHVEPKKTTCRHRKRFNLSRFQLDAQSRVAAAAAAARRSRRAMSAAAAAAGRGRYVAAAPLPRARLPCASPH